MAPVRGRVLTSLAAGMAVGAAAFVIADAIRPRPGTAIIIDWDEIRRRAISRLDPAEELDEASIGSLEADYRLLAADLEAPLLEFVGGQPGGFPKFQALDRQGWVDLNIGIMRDALAPVVDMQRRIPNSRAVEIGRRLLDRYVGLIIGFLSKRVLGQYDPQLLGHEPAIAPGLYLVEPNIRAWQAQAELPGEALRRWLILHEMTHAWQFEAHPWLRDHLNAMLREILGLALDRDQSPIERLLALTTGLRAQLEVVGRVQATMSLIEGYSNLVMDQVGSRVLNEFEALEAAHQARVGEKTIFERLFWKITGLELKLQQYVVGERFCRTIHDAHGMEVLNRAWTGPETLPTLLELRDPDSWAARIKAA